MKFKDITPTEEEVIQSLKDAGIEVFTPEDAEFDKHPTIKELADQWYENRLQVDEICEAKELLARALEMLYLLGYDSSFTNSSINTLTKDIKEFLEGVKNDDG